MTEAQRVQAERYQDLIQRQQWYLQNQHFNFGHHRDVMIEELNKRFDAYANSPRVRVGLELRDGKIQTVAVPLPGAPQPDYNSMSYDQLAAELRKHLGADTDIEQWLNHRIARDYIDILHEYLAPVREQDDQERLVLDTIQLTLDIGGVVDPTPISDGLSAAESLGRLRPVEAGISVVGMLPLLGDSLKILKIPHYIETIRAVVRLAIRHPEWATFIRSLVQRVDDVMKLIPWNKISTESAEKWGKLRDEVTQALSKLDDVIAERAAKAASGPDPLWRQSIADSALLGERLGKQTNDGLAAHHIVAGKLDRFDPARRILDKYQIDINDPANGVLLVDGKGAAKTVQPRRHRSNGDPNDSVHSEIAAQAVYERLSKATEGVLDWATARQRVRQTLQDIGEKILKGDFP
jgi:HNH/ENDO VII superfamily nuclease